MLLLPARPSGNRWEIYENVLTWKNDCARYPQLPRDDLTARSRD